uniref:Transmembrane protein n=1 Tax=Gossypium raimondii TaxID=29730 RepID=A0A0D2PXR6_GOSRA|nr:hypothetical protein B456_002G1730002 [Gossypium raimondii]
MRPTPMEFVRDADDQGSAMEVDGVDTPEIFREGVIASPISSTTSKTILMTPILTKKIKKNRLYVSSLLCLSFFLFFGLAMSLLSL